MSLQKKYLKSKATCKVKFELPQESVGEAKKVSLVGEFNDWDSEGLAMKKQKNGIYTATVDLPAGNSYQFRYLIDGERWENDPDADAYSPNNLCGSDNSVVVV